MATLQQVTYERPPEGLARGRFPAPPWAIILLSAAVVVAAVVFFIVRARAPRAAVTNTGPGGDQDGATKPAAPPKP